jgi:hypothetical protein
VCGVDGKVEGNVMRGYKRSISHGANTERMYGTKIWEMVYGLV